MRACFLGQNVCALGYGVATLQAPPLVMDVPAEEPIEAPPADVPAAPPQGQAVLLLSLPPSVVNSPRVCPI